jgi:hypothetical protein
MFEPPTNSGGTHRKVGFNPGPQQTDVWPLVWGDLDPLDLPSWVTWKRTCQQSGTDGEACPRRLAGFHFGLRYCDKHWPADVPKNLGAAIG